MLSLQTGTSVRVTEPRGCEGGVKDSNPRVAITGRGLGGAGGGGVLSLHVLTPVQANHPRCSVRPRAA
jgi:hypothetical protein